MKETTLEIKVKYNEEFTSPENLSDLANKMMETAFSIYEPMIDHGLPRFGKFSPRKKTLSKKQTMENIEIED